MTEPYQPGRSYTLYADYDNEGQVRQVTVNPPEHVSIDTVRELVQILFRAGQSAVLPSLADTHVLRQPLEHRRKAEDLWSQYQ